MKVIEGILSAKGLRFGIVAARFNNFITDRLQEGAIDALVRHEADESGITVVKVPGAFELPAVAGRMAASGDYDAVICLGTVIRGSTPHFDYVASEAAKGIAQVSMASGVPVVFGVLTCDSIEQAIERAGTKSGNKGSQAAMAAIELASVYSQV